MLRSMVCCTVVTVLAGAALTAAQDGQDKRVAQMEQLKRMLPKCEYFDNWLTRTRALAPDFDSLPSEPFLPDPLVSVKDGKARPVSAKDWPARRQEIADLVETWLLGHAPPAPKDVRAVITEKTTDRGHEVWKVRLEFGPDYAARLNCTLYLPKGDKRPAPVFLCDNRRYMNWAADAMEQGFAFCCHNAEDSKDESKAYADLFGDYDWAAFRRRGWSASRVIDWLCTLDFIDKDKIIIGGHSRSGKSAMAAAAFDPRIAAVIASSPGSGGSMPYRYCDGSYFGEAAENLTGYFSDWVLLKVRFFCGRENKLPADSHYLYSLIAPRPLLMSTAIHDWVESTWAMEQVYKTNLSVYSLLGEPENVALRYRDGLHSVDRPTAKDYSRFMLAVASGQTTAAKLFPYNPIHVWDYDAWAKDHLPKADVDKLLKVPASSPRLDGNAAGWPARRQEIRAQIDWLLGSGGAYQPMEVTFGQGESPERTQLLRHDVPFEPALKAKFGGGLNANLYYPPSAKPGGGTKLPAVLWLGPLSCSSGYTGFYGKAPIEELTVGGFITLGYDPIGTGDRQYERRDFYGKHPDWSLMGKMVLDARHALDVLEKCPDVDSKRIYIVGYAMGGMVGTFTAAQDSRVAGSAIVAGFTPMRSDTDVAGTGGIRRYSHLYGWMPRLGPFVGREAQVPVDFDEVLACAAPRPTLIIAPKLDWHANASDVAAAVERARKVYANVGAGDSLKIISEQDAWNRLTDVTMQQVTEWLQRGKSAD